MRRPHRRSVRRTPHELALADALACPRARAHDQREGVRSVSILVDRDTRVLVQGITGREGSFHTEQMVEYGTNVVSGVTPGGKGKSVAGVPVFDTVAEAVRETQPNVSIIYVPARFAPDAIYEAVDGGIPFVICITEGIPVLDMVPVYTYVKSMGARLQG